MINEIEIFKNNDELFEFAATDFTQAAQTAIMEKDFFSVVLSGGQTPKLFFDVLVHQKNIPWNKIKFFFGDERYLPYDNEENNYHMANEYLFSKVSINPENVYRIPTHFQDPKEAAREYEKILKTFLAKHVSFDLVYLGLGDDAHTASLMPLSDIVVQYADHMIEQSTLVESYYVDKFKMNRITLTPIALANTNETIFLVSGQNKARAVEKVITGPYDPKQYPAQLIQNKHGKLIWYLDKAAAKKIESD